MQLDTNKQDSYIYMIFMYVHIASIYMVRLGLLLIDIAFIIDGCPKEIGGQGSQGEQEGQGA